MGIYLRNLTRPTKSANLSNCLPARETMNGRIRILFYFLIEFWAGCVCRVDARPLDHLIINIKNIYIYNDLPILHFLTRLSHSPSEINSLSVSPPLSPPSKLSPSLSLLYSQPSLFVLIVLFWFWVFVEEVVGGER